MRFKTALVMCLTMSPFLAVAGDAPVLGEGAAAPGLELPSTDGSMRSLAAATGPTVLVFYRGLW